MPFELSWEKHGLYSRFWGVVHEWEIAAKNVSFSNNPRCNDCSYQIFDGTDIESFSLSEYGLMDIASNDIGMGFYIKNLSLILISPKAEIKDVYREYISICLRADTPWRFHICDTLPQARQWLKKIESRNESFRSMLNDHK